MPAFLYCCKLDGPNSDALRWSVGSINERSQLGEIGSPLAILDFDRDPVVPVWWQGAHDPWARVEGTHTFQRYSRFLASWKSLRVPTLGLLLSCGLLSFKETWKSLLFSWNLIFRCWQLTSHCIIGHTVQVKAALSLCQPWTKGFATLAVDFFNSKYYFTYEM